MAKKKAAKKSTKKAAKKKSAARSATKKSAKTAAAKSAEGAGVKAAGKKSRRMKRGKLQEIRNMLLERRKALVEGVLEEYSGVVNRNRTMSGDSTDIAQDLSEESVSLGILANEEEELDQVEAALKRIDEGTYGMCEACGEPIPTERLKFLPYATKCVKCKSMEERNGGKGEYNARFSFGAVEDVSEDDEGDED